MEMRQAKPYVSVIERLAQEEGRREGREEGREEGRKEGQVDLLLHLLTHRFGAAAATIRPRLQTLTIAQIESLVDVALAQATLDAFVEQLPPPAATLSTGTAQ